MEPNLFFATEVLSFDLSRNHMKALAAFELQFAVSSRKCGNTEPRGFSRSPVNNGSTTHAAIRAAPSPAMGNVSQ